MTMNENFVLLNTDEMSIIMYALNNLTLSEEHRLAKEHGSVMALYERIKKNWELCGGKETVTVPLTDASY